MEVFFLNILFQILGLISGIIIAGFLYLKYVTYNYWKKQGIAQADAIVPFGNMWPVFTSKKSMGEFLGDLHLEFRGSPVFGFYSFHRPSLIIRGHEQIRFVLTKQFLNFYDRGLYANEEVDPLSSHLFMLTGAKWKNMRAKLSPTFTSGKIKHMFTALKECSDNLIECVNNEINDDKQIEVKDLMARFSTDVIASVAFGIECNSLRDPNAEFRVWGRKMVAPRLIVNTLMVLCPPLLKLFNIGTTEKEGSNFIIKVFKETVEFRKANNVVRNDFLDLVMQLMDKGYVQADDDKEVTDRPAQDDSCSKLTMLEGAAQAFVFWLAGFESSSSTATHCLYELALNQNVQNKAIEEIDRVLKKFGDITYESISEMPYLHKIVSETLRKYPPLPILNRECTSDIEIPGTGLHVTKGTPIVISVLGLHRDPEFYPDPDKFDPERFSDANIARRHNYAYLPFGEGPRNCIGLRFGLLQTKVGLVTLLSKYRFARGPKTEIPLEMQKGNFLFAPQNGVTLCIEER